MSSADGWGRSTTCRQRLRERQYALQGAEQSQRMKAKEQGRSPALAGDLDGRQAQVLELEASCKQ